MTNILRGSGFANFWKPDFGSWKLINTIIRGYWEVKQGRGDDVLSFSDRVKLRAQKKLCPVGEILQCKIRTNLNPRRSSCLRLYFALGQAYQLQCNYKPLSLERVIEIAYTVYLTFKLKNDTHDEHIYFTGRCAHD